MFRKRLLLQDRIFLVGLVILVLGTAPLLITLLAAQVGITSDPNPNPVFFGMIAAVTFWSGLIIMGVGIYRTARNARRFDQASSGH